MVSFNNLFDTAKNFLKTFKNEDDLTIKFPNFMEDCNNLCAGYIYHYLFKDCKEPSINVDQLKQQLNILDIFNEFYHYMLSVLAEDEIISQTSNKILIDTNYNFSNTKEKEIITKHPLFYGTFSLLKHCSSQYSKALSGNISALSILYPEGKSTFLNQTLALNKAEYSEMPFFINLLVRLIAKLSKKSTLKILEIGGGRGMASKKIFKEIDGNSDILYNFTDIGRRFILDMEHYLAEKNITFVTCNKFDITKDPLSQNFTANDYDIIIGLDVAHVASNITQSLHNLRTILKPNGILCLLETTRTQRWHNLTMGLTKGWWNHDDKWRKNTPLVSAAKWLNITSTSGFKFTYMHEPRNKNSDAALLIASH